MGREGGGWISKVTGRLEVRSEHVLVNVLSLARWNLVVCLFHREIKSEVFAQLDRLQRWSMGTFLPQHVKGSTLRTCTMHEERQARLSADYHQEIL